MVPMTISLPDPLRDFVQARVDSGRYADPGDDVRDLIHHDQGAAADEARWLRDLDASIIESLAEQNAGKGHELDAVCGPVLAELEATGDRPGR